MRFEPFKTISICPAISEAPPAFQLKIPNNANIQAPTMVSPMAEIPSSLPIINSPGVTDESKTSMMRLDFSSMVLLSSIWIITKMASQSK